MPNFELPEVPENLAEIAMERWNVDLNDDRAVLAKIQSMGGKMPDVADLSNMWGDFQEQKNQSLRLAA